MPIVDLVLPKLGESIMEATILKWHKSVGDTIQLDETLLDIATDKVDSEIPSTVAGKVIEILFEPKLPLKHHLQLLKKQKLKMLRKMKTLPAKMVYLWKFHLYQHLVQ